MTTKLRFETCPTCRYDNGVHYSDDGAVSWRPHLQAALDAETERIEAELAVRQAHTQAFEQAKQIITDLARSLPELSGNDTRHLMQVAQIPSGVVGAAFANLNREGTVIQHTGRYIPSDDPATHGHRIGVFRSLLHVAERPRYGDREEAS